MNDYLRNRRKLDETIGGLNCLSCLLLDTVACIKSKCCIFGPRFLNIFVDLMISKLVACGKNITYSMVERQIYFYERVTPKTINTKWIIQMNEIEYQLLMLKLSGSLLVYYLKVIRFLFMVIGHKYFIFINSICTSSRNSKNLCEFSEIGSSMNWFFAHVHRWPLVLIDK